MNAKQKIHQAKLNHWIFLVQQQAASGLTIRQWCEQNNCSFHSFNYWKHILKEEYTDSVLPDKVCITVGDLEISIGSSTSDEREFFVSFYFHKSPN